MHSISKAILTKRIKPDGSGYTVAAGSSDVNSDVIDTAGYEWVRIITGFGTITAGAATSIKLQDGATSSPTTDVLGSAQTVADANDNQIVITEIYRPQNRYLRQVTKRATQNAVIDFMIVEMGGSRKLPITDDATVLGVEVAQSPAQGTA